MKIGIAVVEDNHELRESWVRRLNAHPKLRCVASCESAEVALQRLPECRPDVVLMDINLPGMSGIRCTASLRQLLPKAQILMLTIYSNNDYIFEALESGANGYLLKSSSSEEVIRSIFNVMEGGAPMTGQIARRVIEAFRRPAPHGVSEVQLTEREKEILQYLAQGYSNKEIASKLTVSVSTVRTHVEHIYEKLHVRCRTQAAAKYFAEPERQRFDKAPGQ
jgi:DNA-binding NarL/FixJ family response regulator